jgi:hypothetical protein
MDHSTASPDLAIVQFLADSVEPGWASAPDIAFAYGDADHRPVKTCLGQLHKLGIVDRLYVRHRDAPLACYKLDPEKLHKWLEDQS